MIEPKSQHRSCNTGLQFGGFTCSVIITVSGNILVLEAEMRNRAYFYPAFHCPAILKKCNNLDKLLSCGWAEATNTPPSWLILSILPPDIIMNRTPCYIAISIVSSPKAKLSTILAQKDDIEGTSEVRRASIY